MKSKIKLTESAQFLIIGDGANIQEEKIRALDIYRMNYLTNFLSPADILLHPAQVDNLPNTVAESMSCGTPVLAFLLVVKRWSFPVKADG